MNKPVMILMMVLITALVATIVWVNQTSAFSYTHRPSVQKNIPSSMGAGTSSAGQINSSGASGPGTQRPRSTETVQRQWYKTCMANCLAYDLGCQIKCDVTGP